jgi:hypothetical protein
MNELRGDTAERTWKQWNSFVKWLTVADGDSYFFGNRPQTYWQ